MATYAIGDLHGNLDALKRLLRAIRFTADRDRLWFVGDIVNRGDDSLGCLRFVRALGANAITVLGNHDLALLVFAQRDDGPAYTNPDLAAILAAADSQQLLYWLRQQPLLHHDPELGWTMVHAGIPAEWNITDALGYAAEVQACLRGADHQALLARLFGNQPARWHASLTGFERLRYITNALTRQRFVYADGTLDMAHKAELESAPAALQPWFHMPRRRTAGQRIVFGHWAALTPVAWPRYNVWCIDTGAAWGRQLTALKLSAAPELIAVPGQADV